MSKVVRNVKNITKGYSAVQIKVRNGEKLNNGLRNTTRSLTETHSNEQ